MISKSRAFLHQYAWPLGLIGVIACYFIADGILISAALTDDSFGPEDEYYEKAIRYDETAARTNLAAGMKASITVAEAPIATMPRRVDVRIVDPSGNPMKGLTGTLTAIRPADVRLRNSAQLIEVPGEVGLYRLLLRVPVEGLWEFELETKRGQDAFRMIVRQHVSI